MKYVIVMRSQLDKKGVVSEKKEYLAWGQSVIAGITGPRFSESKEDAIVFGSMKEAERAFKGYAFDKRKNEWVRVGYRVNYMATYTIEKL